VTEGNGKQMDSEKQTDHERQPDQQDSDVVLLDDTKGLILWVVIPMIAVSLLVCYGVVAVAWFWK
jgi:hypothetical protein